MSAAAPVRDAAPVEAAVELRAVTKSFGSAVALDGIDLVIRKGEFFSLLGPSGCGKTTTLNLIGGFETATRGTVLIDGHAVQDTPSHERPVNTVFQSYAVFPHMNVAENVGFGLRMKKVPVDERRRAVTEMLRLVSLEGFEERRPSQLSGGQRQRVALARALVNRPAVLLLDEPLGALDLKLRKLMQAELTRIQRQVGITFVYVTHDQEEALAMSDRIAVMDRGRLLQVGSPDAIYARPASREVMEFIGSVNVLEGRVESAAGGEAMVALAGLGAVAAANPDAIDAGAEVALLVRPEHVRVSAARPGDSSALSGTVSKVAHLGFVTHCTVHLPGGRELLAFRLNSVDGRGTEPLVEKQAVFVSWDQADSRLFRSTSSIRSIGAP